MPDSANHPVYTSLCLLALVACGDPSHPGDEALSSPDAGVARTPFSGGSGETTAEASLPLASLRDAPTAVRIEQVELNGLSFDVRVAGPRDGDVVILLHGFPETSYEWRHQIPELAKAGYRVLAPDLRGTSPGARPADVEAYGLTSFVGDVAELANAYGAFRFHLVGHDVGALVAWGTAQLHALRLRSITALSVPHPAAFASQLSEPDSCQGRASAWYRDLVEDPQAAEKLLAGDPPLLLDVWNSFDPDATAEYRKVLGTPEALDSVINVWRANFVDGQPQGALPVPILAPVLYVWGEGDPYNCPDGEPLTRLLSWGGYRFEKIPGAGHFLAETAPEEFNALLLSHLRRNRF